MINTMLFKLLLAVCLVIATLDGMAAEIRIAVASNFKTVMQQIAQHFESTTGHRVILSFGATGKHYAQIVHGAPFEAFFAADVRRPRLLEEEGRAIPGSRFTYALGQVVLWSPKTGFVDPDGEVLAQGQYRHLAIANPKLAPYGIAAQQVLLASGLWDQLQSRLVRGENIGQTFQFVKSGNAELGFIAYSQVKRPGQSISGSLWYIPPAFYTPIEQQAVQLKDDEATREFIAFIQSDDIKQLIRSYGYTTP